jgi:hypothetical protein
MNRTAITISSLLFMLSGCTYSSANLMRAKGDDIMVFGAWGYVHCVNSSVTLYRSTDAIAYPKDPKQPFPKIPARPTIAEDGTDITIGKVPAATK